MYEILPGFILCTLAIIIVSLLDKEPSEEVVGIFDKQPANEMVQKNEKV
jgi:sodium/proline symporter